MTYQEALQYLNSFVNFEKLPSYSYKDSLKLDRIRDFLKLIDNPQKELKCIHVAGTKGKGSTCAFIAYILKEAGFKVGLYTSPHLVDFRERIRILDPSDNIKNPKEDFSGMISKADLSELVIKIKPKIDEYNRKSKYGPLTFFEVYTTLAFIYFMEKKVDFLVLETGLGGRFDATNVVKSYIYAITPISYEHTDKLGSTLKEIAGEKAGIIKSTKLKTKNVKPIAITAPQEKEVLKVIVRRCLDSEVRLIRTGKDTKYKNLKLRLMGRHQLINAGLAVGVIKALHKFGLKMDNKIIKRGLENTVWPGRCEIIAKNPYIILDGAQNVASALAIIDTIKANFKYRKLVLVLGISSDKDIKRMCLKFYNFADKVILTKADSLRASNPWILSGYFEGKEKYITLSVNKARILAKKIASRKDLVLVTGSLFVVGEFRRNYNA